MSQGESDFVRHFKDVTGEDNLCLAGGVALNSVLNGRLCRELGFGNRVYVPPYPSDDGIAVGCCAYGLFGGGRGRRRKGGDGGGGASSRPSPSSDGDAAASSPRPWIGPLSPYLPRPGADGIGDLGGFGPGEIPS